MITVLPLILTFSRREKEQRLAGFGWLRALRAADRLSFARQRGAFLPLPKREGRGEGKGRTC